MHDYRIGDDPYTELGNSHSKLLYLPEPHTDFVFPIFAEEFGLLGSLGLIFLFAL